MGGIAVGILANAFSISLGSLLGARIKRAAAATTFDVLGIGIMILSAVGFLEGVLDVSGGVVESRGLVTVVFSLILGTLTGNACRLEERLPKLAHASGDTARAITEATLLFGIGGLQLTGPLLLAVNGDSTQLYLKSLVDLPFALLFGATYGKAAALSALPVALMQLGVFGLSLIAAPLLTPDLIGQIASMGYVILFFTGYNTLSVTRHRIGNVNMLPAIPIHIILYLILESLGGLV